MKDRIQDLIVIAQTYSKALPPLPITPKIPQGKALAGYIDHTLLKPEASKAQIMQLCQEAKEHQFASVCINPSNIALAAELLKEYPVAVCSVLGFPLGATTPPSKAAEAVSSLALGSNELDMVINVGALKSEMYDIVFNEIVGVVQIAHSQGAIIKVIIECGLLSTYEKILATLIVKEAQADFVKTSTGMMAGGATIEDVDLLYRVVEGKIGVKAAGGIRTYSDAQAMIQAGATRLGSSAGIKIIQEA